MKFFSWAWDKLVAFSKAVASVFGWAGSKLSAIARLRRTLEDEHKRQAEEAERVFKEIKASVVDKTSADFDQFLANAEERHAKAVKLGQWLKASKLTWLIQVASVERHLEEIGITKCVSTDKVQQLMEDHPTRVLKLIDLASYEREIPDEIAEAKLRLEDVFDEFLVLYTDYTRAQQVKDARNGAGGTVARYAPSAVRMDPILFGLFMGDVKLGPPPADGERDRRHSTRLVGDRLYVIGDWEDATCNLTFSKMVEEAANLKIDFDASVHLHVDKGQLTDERLEAIKAIKPREHLKAVTRG